MFDLTDWHILLLFLQVDFLFKKKNLIILKITKASLLPALSNTSTLSFAGAGPVGSIRKHGLALIF